MLVQFCVLTYWYHNVQCVLPLGCMDIVSGDVVVAWKRLSLIYWKSY